MPIGPAKPAAFTALSGLFALSALTLAPRSAHASPQDLFGYGPRSSAMGGLGASFADDYSAVHSNPAGLSRARETAFSFGFVGGAYDLYTQQGTSPRAPLSVERMRATTIGLTLPLPFGGLLRDRLVVGLGFFTPTDVVVRGRIQRPETPQFLVLADRAQSVALMLGLGVELPAGFRFGVGFAALAAITGTVLVSTDVSGRAGSRVDNQLVASYAPHVGASWERGWLRVGAAFRGTLVGRFGVTIEARDIGLPLPVFNIAGIAQYDPWQVALEASAQHRGFTGAFGATFKRWSAYPGPVEATTMNTRRLPPAVNFSDTLVLRLGGEYRARIRHGEVAARVGYFYEPTPVPAATGVANYLDNDRHVLTVGGSVGGTFRGSRIVLDLFAQAHLLTPRAAVKDATVTAMGGNPGAPSIEHGGAVYVLGTQIAVTF